jgi:D-glycero-alpha-D-manno-heptose-7-phosphate kinase
MIISRTPYRISFFGGGTDYPAWFRRHGGSVLATTIDKYCYLTCRHLPPFFQHKIRVVYSTIEDCRSIEEIKHPAVREVVRYLQIDRGLEIHHDGDLPARSGMGSSSSFTVGLLHGLHALLGQMPTKAQLAAESIEVEQERLKEAVGCQDQVCASYGGFNHLVFRENGDFSISPMTLPQARVNELNSHLMLFYTGIQRTASTIARSYVEDTSPAREATLKTFGAMVDEGIAILRSGQDLAQFGKLLHEAWLAKQSLSQSISNTRVADIYERARREGAIGGKLTGAGGGGFMLLFVPPSKHARIREVLHKLIYVPFAFESSGSQIIFFDREREYLAEERVRSTQTISDFRELAPLPPRDSGSSA